MFIYDPSHLFLLILHTHSGAMREFHWLYKLGGCSEAFDGLQVNISPFALLSLTVATIQRRVRNVWHNHYISSLRGKKHKEDAEKADVLLWQHHFRSSWKEDFKSLSSHQRLICLHLKQRNENAKTCKHLASQWCWIDRTDWGFHSPRCFLLGRYSLAL